MLTCLMVEFYYQPAESLHHFAFEESSNLTNGFTFSTAGRRQRLVEEEESEGGGVREEEEREGGRGKFSNNLKLTEFIPAKWRKLTFQKQPKKTGCRKG